MTRARTYTVEVRGETLERLVAAGRQRGEPLRGIIEKALAPVLNPPLPQIAWWLLPTGPVRCVGNKRRRK